MIYEVSNFIAKNNSLGGSAFTVQQITALEYLVKNLKSRGLWSTTGFLYPFVGSTSVQHSVNLLNPTNYTISWNNATGANYTTNGWQANTTNYGTTSATPSLLGRNVSYFLYNRIQTTSSNLDMGVGTSANERLFITCHYSSGATVDLVYFDCYNASNERIIANSVPVTNSTGFWTYNNNGSGTNTVYRNGTSFISGTVQTSDIIPSSSIFLGSEPNFLVNSTGRQYAMMGALPSISTGNQSTFYSIVQNFQTILGRQV